MHKKRLSSLYFWTTHVVAPSTRHHVEPQRMPIASDNRVEIEEYIYLAQTVTYKYTSDKLKKHISRARLPENPEVNYAGHQHIQFFFILKLQLQLQLYLNTQRNK